MSKDIRDDMLVCMGIKAVRMDVSGDILLPVGTMGKALIADFIRNSVDKYLGLTDDGAELKSFDEYAEEALYSQFHTEGHFFRKLAIEFEQFTNDNVRVLSVIDEDEDKVLNMLEGDAAEEMYDKLITYVGPEESNNE